MTFQILTDCSPSAESDAAMARTGAMRYLFLGQNSVPESLDTGLIRNPQPIFDEISRQLAIYPGTLWGMLDFEDPFDKIINQGPSDSRYAATVDSMRSLLGGVKKKFPKMLWTYYGGPYVPMFSGSPEDLSSSRTPKQRQSLVVKAIVNYAPVLEGCDWTMPCIYLAHSAFFSKQTIAEVLYRRLRIAAAQGAAPGKPCFPAVCLSYTPGSGMVEHELMSDPEFALTQILPALDTGCEGLALWNAFDFYRSLALSKESPFRDEIRKAYVKNWGEAAVASDESLRKAQGVSLASKMDMTADLAAFRPNRLQGDADGDGVVGAKDLAAVLGNWGRKKE